jgi:hypothetical protein
MLASKEPSNDEASPQIALSPERWYVLFVLSFFAHNQCLLWFSFSSVDADKLGCDTQCESPGYYGKNFDINRIDLLLNWGAIVGMMCTPLQTWLLTRPNGLRHCVVLGSGLTFFCSIIRTIPSFCSKQFRSSFASYVLLCIGQILNAAAGPLCMGPVSRLSCLWFGPNERTFATAIAYTSNGMGNTVGFLLGPWTVLRPSDMKRFLLIEIAIAVVPFAMALVYFPDRPKLPPSHAALAIFQHEKKAAAAAAAAAGAAAAKVKRGRQEGLGKRGGHGREEEGEEEEHQGYGGGGSRGESSMELGWAALQVWCA